MDFDTLGKSTKDIILEAIYPKVSFDVFMWIWEMDDLESVLDLRFVLDDAEYDEVYTCVKTFFSRRAAVLYSKYALTCGVFIDDFDECMV